MKQSDVLWLGIRGLGVFCLVKALFVAIAIPGNVSQLSTMRRHAENAETLASLVADAPADENETPAAAWRRRYELAESHTWAEMAAKALWESVIGLAVYTALGLYLSRGGKLLYRFLRFPSDDARQVEEPLPEPSGDET